MFFLTCFGDEISQDLREQIKILRQEGINYLDLRGVNNKFVLDFTDTEIEQIKKELDKNNIKISSIASPIGKIKITDDFEQHLKKFDRALYLAKFFNTKYIRIFSYYLPENEDPLKYREEVMKRMKIKTEIAEKEKVILISENEEGIYGTTAERCKDILDTINSKNLRAAFDTGNFIFQGQRAYTDCFNKLVNYITYLHIKDAKLGKEIKIVVPGEGDSEIKEVLNDLNKRNFSGFASIEPHLTMAGKSSGFTGPDLFIKAIQSLKKIIKEINAEWK